MWNELNIPVVIAHRGDKAAAPENTLSAFKQAADKGADGIEFDVKLTADNHVIVMHDPTVDRTTDGTGKVAEIPLAAMRELDAGKQFPGQFTGEKVPLLEEVFETVGNRLYMNVELTNYAAPFDSLVPQVVELVRKHSLQKKVFFSSFLPTNLTRARRLLPEVPRGQLCMRGNMGMWGRAFGWRGRIDALNPFFTDVDAGLVNRVHAKGKRVYVWTLTTEEDMKRMIGLGVDGLITGNLDMTLHILGRKT